MFLVSTLSILKADSNLVIKRFTINAYGIFDTTPQIYAGLYDMTEAGWNENVRNNIAQVKAIKPSFKALLYYNLRSIIPDWQPEYQACIDNDWFLKDASGNPIATDVGYLVDIGSSGWQNYLAGRLSTRMTDCGYDGVFGDNGLFYGTSEIFYGAAATPINPRTGQPWTNAEVRQAYIELHTAIKNAIGSKLLVCNGIWTGYRYYDHENAWNEILSESPLDGFMSESLWHPYVFSSSCIWMSETQWLQAVQFLIWVQDDWLGGHSNRVFVPMVKLARGSHALTPLPSGCTREQMATYAYASMLLGVETDKAAQIYFCTGATGVTFDLQMQPLYNAQIGTPTNDVHMIGGTHVYTRDFSNGKVLVNPTDQQYSVSLGQAYVTLEEQTVSSLIMEPHTGVILMSGA
jgi:hypothetical protein